MFFTFFVLANIKAISAGNFLILGDWGGIPINPYRTEVEEYTANQMAMVASEKKSKFVVALGKSCVCLYQSLKQMLKKTVENLKISVKRDILLDLSTSFLIFCIK